MNLICVICSGLIKQSEDVRITICGHMFHFNCLMQWIKCAGTCPQCRNPITEYNISRVYFSIDNLDSSRAIGLLQEQLDHSELLLKLKDKIINEEEIQIKMLEESEKRSMKLISTINEKQLKIEFAIKSYVKQITVLKAENNIVDEENKKLRHQIDTMEAIATLPLTSSSEAVEKLLKMEPNRKKLAVWVVTLKRELRNTENKKTDLRNMLRAAQSSLRRETLLNKQLEERILQLERKCQELNVKSNS